MPTVKAYHPAHGGPEAPRRAVAPRRQADPAPSRWTYRKQRLMLTPAFRLTVKFVLPVALVALASGLYLQNETRRTALSDTVIGWKDSFQDRPQFIVSSVELAGASRATETAVRALLEDQLPLSSFKLDLPVLRDALLQIPAVADAGLQVRSGGVLYVGLTERVPVVIWQRGDALVLLDPAGVETGRLDSRLERPGLPLVAGRGAVGVVPEAMAILNAADPLEDRIRGLERIGARRWDLVLDRGQRIMLPERNAVQALEQILALNEAQELLDRDVAAVDMRLAARPTIRLTPGAAEEWRRIRGIVVETGNY